MSDGMPSTTMRSIQAPDVFPLLASTYARGHLVPFQDRKSTRLNSSHLVISYAVFCLKKKMKPVRACPASTPRVARSAFLSINDPDLLCELSGPGFSRHALPAFSTRPQAAAQIGGSLY